MRRVNRDIIKYIAVVTMTLNHASFALPMNSSLTFALKNIGYFTAPVMLYFLTEGFYYTSSRLKYMLRILLFAAISQLPYVQALGIRQLNMLFTMALCLMVLTVWEQIPEPFLRILALAALTIISQFFDWAYVAPLSVVLYYTARKYPGKKWLLLLQPLLFGGERLLLSLFRGADMATRVPSILAGMLAPVAAVLTLYFLYNGKQTSRGRTFHKWFFYIYYPAHLAVLWILSFL